MSQKFWWGFSTNMAKHATNETMVNFTQCKKTASKNYFMSRKLAGNSTSTKGFSQSHSINESDILLKNWTSRNNSGWKQRGKTSRWVHKLQSYIPD